MLVKRLAYCGGFVCSLRWSLKGLWTLGFCHAPWGWFTDLGFRALGNLRISKDEMNAERV